MILDTTSKSLEIVLGGAITTNQLVFMSSWVDVTPTTFTPGSNDGVTNSTTAVDMVAAPVASTQRQVKELSIINLDTVSATITVRLNNSSTIRKLFTATLATGEMLGYTAEGGFRVFTSTGAIKQITSFAPGQIPGTVTNDDAAAGNIGEYQTQILAQGSAINLTTATAANVVSISLTAGDWDVDGTVIFDGTSSTVVAVLAAGIATTSAVLPATGTTAREESGYGSPGLTLFAGDHTSFGPGPARFSLAGTTTVYLIGYAEFTVSTCKTWGQIRARRVR